MAAGSVVMVHASLSALGPVIGGAETVLLALLDVVGPTGTLVRPAQSWQLCDPAFLAEPGVRPADWGFIRDNLPIYDPARTPSRTMGAIAELFRTWPGTVRSPHPHRSISASGPSAAAVVARHDPASPTGETSPLGRLYDLTAQILLLGVGFNKLTLLHLGEERADFPTKRLVANGCATTGARGREWLGWRELAVDDSDFEEVGAHFAQTGLVRSGTVAKGAATLVPGPPLIDFAADWFTRNRR